MHSDMNDNYNIAPLNGINELKSDGQLVVERQHIRLAEDRNRIERIKYLIGIVSIVVSITIAIVAYIHHLNIQEQRAKADFEIKAMEIILNSNTPEDMYNKAKLMAELFPMRVPENLHKKIEKSYGLSRGERNTGNIKKQED